MRDREKAFLTKLLGDRVRFDAPMREYTTFRTGGRAWAVAFPRTPSELAALLRWAHTNRIPYMPLGKGSNLLVSDAGYEGLFVSLFPGFSSSTFLPGPGDTVRCQVGAGLSLARLQRLLLGRGLGGLEFAAGIPGSVGGGIVMNAGTHWGRMQEVVAWVECLHPEGTTERISGEHLGFSYRNTHLPPGAVVVKAELRVRERSRTRIRQNLKQCMAHRRSTQPLGLRSAGSVFLNPPGASAGDLIDRCGLKGCREGGAMVSTKHANFIVNRDHATAEEVFRLIRKVRARVEERFGIRLVPEIRMVGPFPSNGTGTV